MHLTPEDLAGRRRASTRFAWTLGAITLGLYLIGFLIER